MNCIVIDDDKVSLRIIEEFVNRTNNIKLVKSFDNAVDAINEMKSGSLPIDLVFLDIEMPVMTGLDFLNSFESMPQIIIISGKEKYALNAFDYDVTDFLLKPVTYSRFFKAVTKAMDRYNKTKIDTKDDDLFIKQQSALIRVKHDEILWVEALENYVVFRVFADKYTVHYTMKLVEEKLPAEKFIRVHRSYVVNVNKISFIEDNFIIMETSEGKKSIPIGKSYKDNLLSNINLVSK